MTEWQDTLADSVVLFGSGVSIWEPADLPNGQAVSSGLIELLVGDSASEKATIVLGSAIRCLPRHEGRESGRRREDSKGIQGPDGIVVSVEPENHLVIHAVIEIKSTYVSPCKIAAQFRNHLSALARGVRIEHEWFDANMVQMGSTGDQKTSAVAQIYVQPASWLLTRGFHFEPTENAGRRLVMQDQQLPVTGDTCAKDEARGWHVVTLAWSYDALRAAAFCLVRGYMAEVGEALARIPDPDVPLRTDMRRLRRITRIPVPKKQKIAFRRVCARLGMCPAPSETRPD